MEKRKKKLNKGYFLSHSVVSLVLYLIVVVDPLMYPPYSYPYESTFA
jgi:hypothetical protein